MDPKVPHFASQATLVGEIIVKPLKRCLGFLNLPNFIKLTFLSLPPAEVTKAAETWENAFVGDPMARYFEADKKRTSASKLVRKMIYKGLLYSWRRKYVMLTVNGGAAIVVYSPTYNDPDHRSAMERLLAGIIKVINKIGTTKEQRKRQKEFEAKKDEAIARAIGEREKEMAILELLCTDPPSQGRGYGGALVDAVTSLADLAAKDTWLLSSNINNTGFYESHGFNTAADIVLGDDNPEWHEPPVVVKLMIRDYDNILKGKSIT